MVALVLFVTFAATTVRVFVWPSLPPLPRHADAIIELAGPGDGDAVTMALAQQHLAPLVIQSTLARDVTPAENCLPPVSHVTVECFNSDPAPTRASAARTRWWRRRVPWKYCTSS